MRKINPTNTFKRDLKRMKKRGKTRDELEEIIQHLAENEPVPVRCRPHKLSGNWSGYWECHIEPDWLLVYALDDPDTLTLVATGSHADLFK